jgi:hypothetical protein
MLSSVSATALAKAGIQLQAPTSAAVVSQAAAERTAVLANPGSAVSETILADFSNTHSVPAINALAWAVSLTFPSGRRAASAGPHPGHRPMEPSYLVVFIDATTGAFIMATSGGRL